jgi:sulfur relay (sulfurtransferase) complex TusBCD TusD component (DsrE family)
MKIIFVICVTALESEYSYIIPHLASKAKAKGHDVMLYFYGEGSYCVIKDQKPERLPSLSCLIERVASEGVKVWVGGLCAKARGVGRELVPGCVEVGGSFPPGGYLTSMFEEMDGADKVIFIG